MSDHAEALRTVQTKDKGGRKHLYPEVLEHLDDEDRAALVDALQDTRRIANAAIANWLRDHPDVPDYLKVHTGTIRNWRAERSWERFA